MSMPHGAYQGTCVKRTIPRKYGIFIMLTVTLFVWSLAVPTKNSYAIKSVIDQCQDQGYSDGMVREVAKLFPDSRALMRARELAVPPAPIAQQALSDYDKKVLEERIYNQIVDRFTADGMDIATLLVSYVGHMQFKVVVSIRTRELPYPRIRQTHERMRTIIEQDVLAATFSGFQLAELSSFTVLNRRNGRFYEYPVLYQNLALPFSENLQYEGPRIKDGPRPSVGEPGGRFPWGDRPWEKGKAVEGATPGKPKVETRNIAKQGQPLPAPATAPRSLPQGSYTEGDFYGAPPVKKPALKPAQ